jgi:hypothetical protein
MGDNFAVFDDEGHLLSVNSESELQKHLKNRSEEALRKQIAINSVMVGNSNFLSGGEPDRNVKQAIAFARMELDRRAARQAEKLAEKTTWISGVVAILATIIGACLGAWFSG